MPANDFQYTAMQSLKTRAATGGWTLSGLGHRMDDGIAKVEIETFNRTTGKHRTERFDIDAKGVAVKTWEYEKDLD